MNTKISKSSYYALLKSLYEYVIITLPIGLYVTIEAIHKKSLKYLITSPEWGIAIIFLIYIGITDYISSARKSKEIVNEISIKILNLIRLIGIIASLMLTHYSVNSDTITLKFIRIIVLIFCSFGFIFLMTGANRMKKK